MFSVITRYRYFASLTVPTTSVSNEKKTIYSKAVTITFDNFSNSKLYLVE